MYGNSEAVRPRGGLPYCRLTGTYTTTYSVLSMYSIVITSCYNNVLYNVTTHTGPQERGGKTQGWAAVLSFYRYSIIQSPQYVLCCYNIVM